MKTTYRLILLIKLIVDLRRKVGDGISEGINDVINEGIKRRHK